MLSKGEVGQEWDREGRRALRPGTVAIAVLFAFVFATGSAGASGLPDGRAYEQASPMNKDGGDVTGTPSFIKAAIGGNGITFGSDAGFPGGVGAQAMPYYLATRIGEGEGGSWSTQGILPPGDSGQNARLLGWTADLSRVYQSVVHFGATQSAAIFERPEGGGTPTQITPFAEGSAYAFAGASADDEEAVFESRSGQLGTGPAGIEGKSNVYAWDAGTKTLSLVSRLNTTEETEAALPSGAVAGPYDWAKQNTSEGGARSLYYTHDTNAVGEDGSVFFTAAGSGHIYERINPTQPQSHLNGEGKCDEPAKACTSDVSASRRSTPDTGGHQPAAFQFASTNGETALFTSAEKLTDDANTGPEVSAAAEIGRLTLNGSGEKEEELDEYFPGPHAVGVALDGNHIYWADPNKGTIARATLNDSEPLIKVDETFIEPGETCFETHPVTKPEVVECAPSTPRFLAVADGYVYWTNTGPLGNDANGTPQEEPVKGGGTVGRAKINPTTEEAEEIKPEFIKGASNPQGIAVNAGHIYWANSLRAEFQHESFIARAGIGGEAVEQRFFETEPFAPYGLALSATHIYWASDAPEGYSTIEGIPLEGGAKEVIVAGQFLQPRDVAVAGSHLYWTEQATGTIGRVALPLQEPSDPGSQLCSEIPRCEGEFIEPGGGLLGLAADASGSHLYWSANGEIPPHPGNDLYRYRAAGTGGCGETGSCLDDLSADGEDENGAEVLGVVGASADASRVYFVANAVLSEVPNEAGEVATPGTCSRRFRFVATSGRCDLYLWEGGRSSFIAQLNAAGESGGDSTDWLPTISNNVLATQKTAFASADGKTLLFKSREELTSYDNEGASELYLYRLGEGIACVSCDPNGAAPGGDATLGTIQYPLQEATDTTANASRNLAADGQRAFFESVDSLVADDTNGFDSNGAEHCPTVGTPKAQAFPACRDVYEWEAPGAGSCEVGAPAFSAPNAGCLYLISTGKSDWTSFFLDASADGKNVFFVTRQGLVGQDKDELLDVYDARVGGGIAAQNLPPKVVCGSIEACREPGSAPPAEESAASATFAGSQNPPPKRGKTKRMHHHKKHHHKKRHHRPTHSKREAGR